MAWTALRPTQFPWFEYSRYRNILRVVEAAGADRRAWSRPSCAPFRPRSRYREVAGVRSRLLREPYPVSTGPVCEALLRPEMPIEIDSYAVL